MNIKRIVKHLLVTHAQARRAFPRSTLSTIEKTIKASEAAHVGEIRVVVEASLDGVPLFKEQSARERAIDVFSNLHIWDTHHNNGLLIYILLADRAVEIVADRGLHEKVPSREWKRICLHMEESFQLSNYESGIVGGLHAVTQHLIKHFPATGDDRNELPNRAVML